MSEKPFLCPECGETVFKCREDDLRRCAECGWVELTSEMLVDQERYRREWEVEKQYPTLSREEMIQAWEFKHR